jgi:diadenylate cyclase
VDSLLRPILGMRLIDLLDIGIVSLLIYIVLAVLRDTRSIAAMRGVMGVLLVSLITYTVAISMKLTATVVLFDKLWVVIVITLVMVFQNEIRKAVQGFGQVQAMRQWLDEGEQTLQMVLEAVKKMSKEKIGALICIERRDPLHKIIRGGTEVVIDAQMSMELLVTIFSNYSPLHDGAVILRGNRITLAACMFPQGTTYPLPKGKGSRHGAAMGATEDCDAVVIVVSEETGDVSLAVDGKLETKHTIESLRETLGKMLNLKEGENRAV